MTIQVFLPSQFTAPEIFPVIRDSFGTFSEIPTEVDFEFSNLRFVRPSGIVFLSNVARYLHRSGCRVTFSGMRRETNCIRFLDDSKFFEQHIGQAICEGSSPRSTTQPLREVRHEQSHNWLRSTLIPWLSISSQVPEHDLYNVQTCISEIFNNINDHSSQDVGSIFAQWYPNERRVIISVADFGQGIPNAVRTVEGELSDPLAITRAFDNEFSSKSTPRNRGVGLFDLKQNVVGRFGGRVTVHSLGGAVEFRNVDGSVNTSTYNVNGYCPGTLIDIELSTDRIEITNGERESFTWI
ncbi:ATP-binding protein [Roseibium sp.]|uniref:ATP-binding protein n=1 Tax=Roseibium sp. TaxID=1936156 RepID=UPI003B5043FA